MRVVGVDWSGRIHSERRYLWTAEVHASGRPGVLVGRTRDEVASYLLALADRDSALVVGLDFGFSLPAWFLHDNGIDTVDELWSDTQRLEQWILDCAPPFWGRPGHRCPADL